MADEDWLSEGTVIRPSMIGPFAGPYTALLGGGGLFFLVLAAIVQHTAANIAVLLTAGVGAIVSMWLIVWRYYIVITSDTIADASSRRRPRHVVPREAIGSVSWMDRGKQIGGLLLDADGNVMVKFSPQIAEHQMRKIAEMLDKPFVRSPGRSA